MRTSDSELPPPSEQTNRMFPLTGMTEGRWDGPHFRLFRCGMNDFHETAPPVSMLLDVIEPLGGWEYVLSGSLYYAVGKERYRVNAGQALVMRRPDRGWLLRPVEGAPLRTLWMFVKDEAALRMFDHLRARYGPIQQFTADSSVVRLAKELVSLVADKPLRTPHYWSEKTFEWMNAWWEYAEAHHESWHCANPDVLKPLSVPAEAPQTVKGFASQMGYSRSYLTRKLAQHWSCSPGVVLREVRLQKAAELLRSTQLSIGEIATKVGYSASAAFGRAFVQFYKQTPRAYRHAHQ